MMVSKASSEPAKVKIEKTWATHSVKVITLLSVKEMAMDLGIVVEMKQISESDRLTKKKYIGV